MAFCAAGSFIFARHSIARFIIQMTGSTGDEPRNPQNYRRQTALITSTCPAPSPFTVVAALSSCQRTASILRDIAASTSNGLLSSSFMPR